MKEFNSENDHWQAAVEFSPSGMLMIDLQGRIVLVNREIERIFGYSREELLGQPFSILVPERFREAHAGFEKAYLANPQARAMGAGRDLVGRRKDGSDVPIEIGLNPIRTEKGSFILSSIVDITERKRAEQRFQAAIESSPSGMVLTNSSGIIMFVNRETERLFGYTRKELLGKSIEILVPERFRSKHPAYREEFFHHPSTRFMGAGRDLYGVRKDGVEIPLEIGLNPIETDEGLLVLSAIVDISERKRSEAALRRTAEELQRSNQELEQFAYVASHDLQEPLRMINGFLKLLESRYNAQLDEKGRTYIEYAVQGSDRMSQLINDLLEYSRVQRKQPRQEPVDLNSAIQRAMANLQASVQESGTILSQDPLPVVQGNPTQLAQLFQNLVGNAIKFRRKGTTPQIAIKCRQQEDHWVISVQDNGIGIPPEHREKVFAIFQRLHGRKEYPGTGIGLAICKKIIEQHGGRIWVDSQQGEGSTFFFTLPKAQL